MNAATDNVAADNIAVYVYRAVLDAARLMQIFITRRIPVCIGIGLGSFETIVVRQQFEDKPKRLIVSARFLGTAVKNAYEAEQYSPHGLRIFLHSDFVASQLRGIPGVVAFVPDAVSSGVCPSHAVVNTYTAHEINYLHSTLRKETNVTKSPVDSNALIEKVCSMLANAPEQHREHYASTLQLLRKWAV